MYRCKLCGKSLRPMERHTCRKKSARIKANLELVMMVMVDKEK